MAYQSLNAGSGRLIQEKQHTTDPKAQYYPVERISSRHASEETLTHDTSITTARKGVKTRRCTTSIVDTWTLEIVLSILALGCLAAITAVLLTYRGKAAPSLPFNMTLNTLISIIATGAKSSTIAVVASSLGQAKWIHFRSGTRPLSQVQLFDDASSGPLGSMWLFFGKAALSLPAIGALLIIVALPYDPFIQQLITFSQPESTGVLTSKANAFFMTESAFRTQAISNAIYGNIDDFGRRPSCPSGNCTWAPFDSLGWCSKCEDMTSEVNTDDCTWSFSSLSDLDPSVGEYTGACNISFGKGNSLPLQWSVSLTNATRPTTGSTSVWTFNIDNEAIWTIAQSTDFARPSPNATYLSVSWPQLVLGYLRMDFADPSAPEKGATLSKATQCVLSYCTTTDTVRVAGSGVHQQNRSEPNFGTVFLNPDGRPCWTADPGAAVNEGAANDYTNITVYARSRSLLQGVESTYSIDPAHFTFCYDDPGSVNLTQAPGAWGAELARAVTGTLVTVGKFGPGAAESMDSDLRAAGDDIGDGFSYIVNFDRDIAGVAERMAAAYTDLGYDRNKSVNTTEDMKGLMFSNERLMQLRWWWGALPVGIWVVSVLFLVFVAVKSRSLGLEVWKGGTLVYLFSGIGEQHCRAGMASTVAAFPGPATASGYSRSGLPSVGKLSEMESIARRTGIRLSGSKSEQKRIVIESRSMGDDAGVKYSG
ncbi:uncharacterized protein AB675_3732 [Cyphellophora attinorum]|uniref:Uncharacterized protein n=1 Tax=Cyphellophora attinorum TaxID=1664694 RepID=A0A0N1NW30_9EURO|nr:uncharacterized protein AB675_3732 [Phialophora attinorum]KPI35294.1 hypothetical protein AB675_3732 [Phialophora attinorum]